MENFDARRQLDQKRINYVEIQRKVSQSNIALGLSPQHPEMLVPVTSPAIGVRISIIRKKRSSPANYIFEYFASKIRNFNKNKFQLFLERAYLPSSLDGLPLRFCRSPVPPNAKFSDLANGIVIMEQKTFADEALEDEQTLADQHNKLSLIKRFDMASHETNDHNYNESSAVQYEVIKAKKVFACRSWSEDKGRWLPATLGIDLLAIYVMTETFDDQDGAIKLQVCPIKPSLPMTQVEKISWHGQRVDIVHRAWPGSLVSRIVLESEAARQIYYKIDYILTKLRGKTASGGYSN